MQKTKVIPKEYTLKILKSGNGEKIKNVLLHYYKYVNFYKKNKTNETDIVEYATKLFT